MADIYEIFDATHGTTGLKFTNIAAARRELKAASGYGRFVIRNRLTGEEVAA